MDSESKYRGLNSSMMWMNGCSSLFSLSRSHLLIPSFFTRLRPTDTTQSIKETSNRLTRSLTPLLTALLRPTPIFIHYQAHYLILPAPNSSLNLMGSHLHSTCTETFFILVIQGYPLIRASLAVFWWVAWWKRFKGPKMVWKCHYSYSTAQKRAKKAY